MRWFPINRKALPGVLLGMEPLPAASNLSGLNAIDAAIRGGDLALGVEREFDSVLCENELSDAKILVVDDKKAADLFSWLNTYSQESFPLSQFARVVSLEDLSIAGVEGPRNKNISAKNSPWASIVLGEMLGQGEPDSDLSTLPLSRATACFSYTVARTVQLYGPDSSAVGLAATRLRALQNDSRFSRRAINVDDLTSIWGVARSGTAIDGAPHDTVRTVIEALELIRGQVHPNSGKTLYEAFIGIQGLDSDSAEKRVRAFDRVAEWVFQDPVVQRMQLAPVLLAAAAFLVGRGTSHIALIMPFSARIPSCFVWFALFAGLSGPRYWHATWARTVRGVERQLRQISTLTEPSSADLCWLEYFWLSSTFDSMKVFMELPKLYPKVLSVELVPGAACQFRLDIGPIQKPLIRPPVSPPQPPAHPHDIDVLLARIEDLSQLARTISGETVGIQKEQSSLFNDVSPTLPLRPQPKTKRTKK